MGLSDLLSLEYLDKLKVRGILVPERTGLEGQHGTLAEAEAHADVALTQADLTHRYVVDQLNTQVVDPLLTLNYGQHARGAVQVVPAPIVDAKRGFFRDLYKTLLSNPNFQAHELSALDLDALKDTLGLPKSTEIDRLGKQPLSPSLHNPGAAAFSGSGDDKGHWVTINGNPVFIQGRAPKGVDSKTIPNSHRGCHINHAAHTGDMQAKPWAMNPRGKKETTKKPEPGSAATPPGIGGTVTTPAFVSPSSKLPSYTFDPLATIPDVQVGATPPAYQAFTYDETKNSPLNAAATARGDIRANLAHYKTSIVNAVADTLNQASPVPPGDHKPPLELSAAENEEIANRFADWYIRAVDTERCAIR